MNCRKVTCLIVITAILSEAAAKVIIAPHNTEAKVGDTTFFNCSTNERSHEIFWYHNDLTNIIYSGGNDTLKPYNGRFKIDRDESKGKNNLVIDSVKFIDAGTYICADDDGSGKKVSAQLVVLVGKVIRPIAPSDTESKVGDTTFFNCSTNEISHAIFWYHNNWTIYNGHKTLKQYNKRFYRDESPGTSNLVITSVQRRDAGKYICADDDGSGPKRSAELIVLESDPVCQFNTQKNDEVQLTCSFAYLGNIPPQMEFENVVEKRSIKDNVTSNDDGKSYTLTLKGGISFNKSSYICQTKRSAKDQYTCNFEMPKALRKFLDHMRDNWNVYTAVVTAGFFVVLALAIVICKKTRRCITAKVTESKCWPLSTIKGKVTDAVEDSKENPPAVAVHTGNDPIES